MARRILVIDDQKDIRDVYLQILSNTPNPESSHLKSLEDEIFSEPEQLPIIVTNTIDYDVDCASQGLEAVEMVRRSLEENNPYMVAFVDMRMPPGIDGKETAKRIRDLDDNIELVVITAFSDHLCSDIVDYIGSPSKLLYLKKPFDVEEIKQIATNLTEKWLLNLQNKEYTENLEKIILERTREIIEKNKTLERLSTMDILTELNNTQKFYDELEKEIERLRKLEVEQTNPNSLVLVMVDIDNLKYYNELFGHWNGDMILKTVAEILKMTFRRIDIISRVGGDEFMIILPQTEINTAKTTCDRLLDCIIGKFTFKDMVYLLDKTRIQEIKTISGFKEDDIVQISITGGLVEYCGEAGADKLVNKAHQALRLAKSKGRNVFHIIDHE
ncbi:MAG: diguanylate cyclase [Candidatus Delongbacteria bacterium]|nr:diguanylate cyclase [Candidatus Delongbacteria bacterium]